MPDMSWRKVPPFKTDEIYAWLELERTTAPHHKAFVIVEGGLDRRVYRKILDDYRHCIILTSPKFGRKEIEDTFPMNEVYGPRTLGIIDRDFDYADPGKTYAEGLVVIPTHDVETLVLSTPAFENLLDDCVDPSDRVAFEERCKKTIIAAILRAARPIGLLRLHNSQRTENECDGMNFKDGESRSPRYREFIDESFSSNLDLLIKWVLGNTKSLWVRQLPPGQILVAVAELDPKHLDDWLVCQGHDLVGLIALGLQQHFGNRSEDLQGIIQDLNRRLTDRGILKAEYLHGSPLCDRIVAWEEAHPPFRVLRDAARTSSTSPSRIEESG